MILAEITLSSGALSGSFAPMTSAGDRNDVACALRWPALDHTFPTGRVNELMAIACSVRLEWQELAQKSVECRATQLG